MKKNKILIINDYQKVHGGCDKVANYFYDSFKLNNKKDTYFFSNEKFIYKKHPLNVFKNLFNISVYKTLNKEKSNYSEVYVHSWTKQLSSSIFAIKFKKIFLVMHDYFLFCPNGGFFNFKKRRKCNLIGGSLKCFLSNCDKQTYLIKVYRFIRFIIQRFIIQNNISRIKFIPLNSYQRELLINKNYQFIPYKNKIPDQNFIKESILLKNKFIFYIGRHDIEKGIEDLNYINNYSVISVGGEFNFKNNNIDSIPWITDHKKLISIIKSKGRVLIFPSYWLEVDPLVPWEIMSLGIPVVTSSQNILGIYFSKEFPELVYSNHKELNNILRNIFDDDYYRKTIEKVKHIYKIEKQNRVFYEKNLF